MVKVLAHHKPHVGLPPLFKVQRVVQIILGTGPHVGKLVHHIHAEFIAGIQQHRSRRVVRDADGIESGLFQQPDLTELGIPIGRSAEDAAVVVDAGPAELDALPVHAQTSHRIQCQAADAEAVLGRVNLLLSVTEAAFHSVQRRAFLRPESGIFDKDALTQGLLLPGFDEKGAAFSPGLLFSFADRGMQIQASRMQRFVDDARLHA